MSLTFVFTSPANIRLPVVGRQLPILLLLGDISGFVICLGLVFYLNFGQPLNCLDPLVYALTLFVLVGLYLADAYRPDTQVAGLRAPARILICCTILGLVFASFIYLAGVQVRNPLLFRSTLLITLALFAIWAVSLRMLAVNLVRQQVQQTRWLIVGADDAAIKLAQKLLALNPLQSLFVLAEADRDTTRVELPLNCVGSLNDLKTWSEQNWSGVIVATQAILSNAEIKLLMSMRLRGISIYRISDLYENLWYKLPSSLLQDRWFAFSYGFSLMSNRINIKLKRFVDIAFSGILLIALFPLMLVAAVLIKLESPGPVFYRQLRSGQYGQPFKVSKFRSMYQDAEKRGAQWASSGDPRVTRVGRWMRLTRIDELPQIWNVLRGEMSLIGPRPERPEFDVKLKEAIPYYELRYLVKPGITGWAQVMYPYGASIEDAYEKVAYDLYYIKNYSLWLDLAIIFKTIRVVLLGKGR